MKNLLFVLVGIFILFMSSCKDNSKESQNKDDDKHIKKELTTSTATLKPFNLTDANWKNGISIKETGFFVSKTKDLDSTLKVGDLLEFYGSGFRKITRLSGNDKYLNIYVSGQKLNPETDGYPNEVIIRKE